VPKLPRHCPACNSSLMVTRLTCPKCGTEVIGSFQPDLFSRLTPNDFDFVVLFVKSRGNVKEMERELGISYWTIRSRLNEIVDQLGFESAAPSTTATSSTETAAAHRQQILEQLKVGQLTVNEAAVRLEELKNQP
jgi:hypothetical protein